MPVNHQLPEATAAATTLRRAFLAQTPLASLIVSSHGRIQCASPKASAVFGIEKPEDMEGWSVQFAPAVPAWQSLAAVGRPAEGHVTDLTESCCRLGFPGHTSLTIAGRLHAIGRSRALDAALLVQLLSDSLPDPSGPIAMTPSSVASDRRDSMEKEMETLLQQLDSVEVLLDSSAPAKSDRILLGHISHGLRTPANGIHLAAELLSESSLSSEQRVCLDAILHSSRMLTEYTNTLLEYWDLQSAAHSPKQQFFDLRSMLAVALGPEETGCEGADVFVSPAVPDLILARMESVRRSLRISSWAMHELGVQPPLAVQVDYEEASSVPAITFLLSGVCGMPRCPIPPGVETYRTDARRHAAALLGLRWSILEHEVEITQGGSLALMGSFPGCMTLRLAIPLESERNQQIAVEEPVEPDPAGIQVPDRTHSSSVQTTGPDAGLSEAPPLFNPESRRDSPTVR